jgi:cell division protein FtsB
VAEISTEMIVVGGLNGVILILVSIVGFFLARLVKKVDEVPVEIAKAHARISKLEVRVERIGADIEHLKEDKR